MNAFRIAGRLLPGKRSVRQVNAEAAPLLHGSPPGKAFLAASGPRALALGDPAESCPARAAGFGASPVDAASAAIAACFASLKVARAGSDCGCKVIALDGALLGKAEDFAYAPGVSARLVTRGGDVPLVAREAPAMGGGRLLELHPAPNGPVTVTIDADGVSAVLTEGGGRTMTGRRVADGLGRGRYRERFELTAEDGARAVLTVGFEPVEFAVRRRELLAWLRR